jgi:phosphoribosylamine--glycine ligase
VVDWCKAQGIDLVMVGPEAPLVAGLADDLADAGIRAFGPSAAAAQLEGSKKFMKVGVVGSLIALVFMSGC